MRRAFTVWELLVLVATLLILAAIILPVFNRTHCNDRSYRCQSNQKQIGLAFLQYAQDFDGRLPPVASRSLGWADLLQPYAKNWRLWDCPSTPINSLPATDYFFNGRCAGVTTIRMVPPARTILIGEGDDARPTSMQLRSLPRAALENQKSPAWRHVEGANYTFADGHARWIRPADLEARMKWNPRHSSP